jgi:hypothetical protein
MTVLSIHNDIAHYNKIILKLAQVCQSLRSTVVDAGTKGKNAIMDR